MVENEALTDALLEKKPDFDRFYSDTLEPVLKELEARRLRELTYVIAFTVFGGVASGCVVYWILKPHAFWNDVIINSIGAVCIGLLFFGQAGFHTLRRYGVRNRYKKDVIERIAKFVRSDMIFEGSRSISRYTVESSCLFPDFDVFRGEDYFSCRIDKTRVEFSELTVEKITGAGKSRRVKTVFKGVYFAADFNKDFKGLTIMLPDRAEAALGWVGKKFQEWNFTRPGELVSLEDSNFEQAFVVYSTDQVEARYLLSPAMMEQIMKLRGQFGYGISLAFVNSRLHVAISRKNNDFDPPLFASLVDRRTMESYYNSIRHTLSIVERLNLNRRVWTKR